MTPDWKTLDSAPHDEAIWLFLPGSVYDLYENGTVKKVRNQLVLGGWSSQHSCWIEAGISQRHVYPSLWTERTEEMPAEPVLN